MKKIDVISGFLGAGKTTVIKKLLAGPLKGTKVVLIENEFGEIGIDGGFLKEAGIQIREMNSGCICCSLVGDFGQALREVIDTYEPDRIVIEPSGVGKLTDVIAAVKRVSDETDMEISCAATVVDVLKCRPYMRNFGEFYKDQIRSAACVIMTRTDLPKATQEKVDEAIRLIREVNEDVIIVTTPIDQLDADKLLATMENGRVDLETFMADEHEHHHHDHEGHDHDHDHHYHDHDDDHDHEHHHHDHEHDDHDHDHHDHDHEDHEHHHDHDHDHEHHHHDHHHHHHHHHADDVFASWGMETAHKFTKADIESKLAALADEEKYGQVLRAKGIVEGENGVWLHFDMVPEETEIREGAADVTGRICVIGAKIKEDAIAELFQ